MGQIKAKISELTADAWPSRPPPGRRQSRKASPPPRGPVALIFGDQPVTRDELANYLLRMTGKQFDEYLEGRVLESACKRNGIRVTEADLDDYIDAELKKADFIDRRSSSRSCGHGR